MSQKSGHSFRGDSRSYVRTGRPLWDEAIDFSFGISQ